MITKSVEISDRATFIPAIAIKMVPGDSEAERYLLWRCGYSPDHPAVILLRMDGAWGSPAPCDPYDWPERPRTMRQAHLYITAHFDELSDGQVIDIEWILKETSKPKVSERLTLQEAK